ncbi:MAG: ferredoxin [Candidatus Cloacimonadota bacterium]|nr:MAG: ferredoxin [Candidatus Cloacimonadota bacterium]
MADIKIQIDNKELVVPQGTTIISAAKRAGRHIPTLCYHQDLKPTANCGVCVVEIEGVNVPKRACVTPCWDGMKITTNSRKLRKMRKTLVEIILSDHDVKCPTCLQNGKCELQDISYQMGIQELSVPTIVKQKPVDDTSLSIVRDPSKCISCGRCITVCSEIQTVNALVVDGRGFDGTISTAFNSGMGQSACVNCGQCTVYCPVGALREKTENEKVWDALLDPEKVVIVQEAPSIRATLGEEFGLDPQQVTVGKMYAALRRLGFDHVLDTNFSADLTIMEEANELVKRVATGGTLPMITSCSPGWVKFMETFFPNIADHVSTCKSPQQMFGALVKTYFAEKENIDPAKIVSVAVMPCTAKKFEARRPEMSDSGFQDVDYVLTTREFIRMIKEAGLDFKNLPEEKSDLLMGEYTGAGTIFGATGGVMEAATRTAYNILSGKDLGNVEIKAVRGLKGVKKTSVTVPTKDFGELTVNVAVAHGLGNARKLMEKVQAGEENLHFIEVMACPGGCVGGGGQPFGSSLADRARRGQSLYKEDHDLPKRCSHHNGEIHKMYDEWLGEIGGPKAHNLLHTHYFQRSQISGTVEKEITHKH